LIQSGYLVLADLSGYTPFVATTELDHAHVLIGNILRIVRRYLTPPLQLAEVEGDALFLFVPAERMQRGETLLEVIERAYVGFRDALQAIQRSVTCPCQACQAIPSLDLKFVTHYGEYALEDLTGSSKPFGSSVNVAHRLLKNPVASETGWQAYALFTELALERMGVRPQGMHGTRASYEHLGEHVLGVLDLRQRYVELTAQRRAFLEGDDAHFTIRRRYGAAPSKLWELLNDPHLRTVWEQTSDWSARERPGGRTGPGAHNHCANSDFLEEVLDWRPFDYYTVRLSRGPIRFTITGELRPDDAGTELRWSIIMEGGAPRVLRSVACRFFAARLMGAPARFDRLDRLLHSAPAAPDDVTSTPV